MMQKIMNAVTCRMRISYSQVRFFNIFYSFDPPTIEENFHENDYSLIAILNIRLENGKLFYTQSKG